ncbi:MAG: DNA polymerase III subunit delta [Lachnospiraceae bacterium]|nr:DNA polymerase III subunit delta [Lachnospiraceae bacterium]
MSEFDRIVGHEKVIQYFQNAIAHNKLAHSYIIAGEKGSGKKMLTRLLVKTLQCEKEGIEPCGECRSCIQADAGSHPDIKWIEHEKPATIGASDVREQLVGDICIKPYSGKYKIYIIDEAEKLTPQAQNALLKTIEEPPEYGIILFLATNSSFFLPTITSRCLEINLHPISDGLVKQYLMEQAKVPSYMADVCVAFAQGNIGKALLLAKTESFEQIRNHVIRIMKNLDNTEFATIMSFIKALDESEFDINDYLDLLLMWYRDVLIYKASKDRNKVIFREEVEALAYKAETSTYEGINKIIMMIEQSKARLKANVNEEVVMELMFLTMKEN